MTSEAWSAGCARSSRSSAKPSAPGIRRWSPPARVHCNGSHAPSGRDRCHPNPRRRLPLPANLQTAAASVNRNEVFDVFESRAVRLSRVVAASQPPATRFRWCPAESRWASAPHPPGRSLCAEHPSTSHTGIPKDSDKNKIRTHEIRKLPALQSSILHNNQGTRVRQSKGSSSEGPNQGCF